MAHITKTRVISLLIKLNRLIAKINKLKIKKGAPDLLADALAINEGLLTLLRDGKTDLGFVKEVFLIVLAFVKDVVSKWLFRCKSTPLSAIII